MLFTLKNEWLNHNSSL
jgi:hypothetical protein